jgi:Cu/Ag efflux protein CusF
MRAACDWVHGFAKVPDMEAEMKKISIFGVTLWLLLSIGYAAQNKTAPAGKKEHVFKGKVEKIDLANKTFTVNGQKVEGWMDAMTMNYVPDKEDVLKRIKVGDEITAKVYDGDFRTLFDIQVVPPKPGESKTAVPSTEKKAGKK